MEFARKNSLEDLFVVTVFFRSLHRSFLALQLAGKQNSVCLPTVRWVPTLTWSREVPTPPWPVIPSCPGSLRWLMMFCLFPRLFSAWNARAIFLMDAEIFPGVFQDILFEASVCYPSFISVVFFIRPPLVALVAFSSLSLHCFLKNIDIYTTRESWCFTCVYYFPCFFRDDFEGLVSLTFWLPICTSETGV